MKRDHTYPPIELIEPVLLERMAKVLGKGLKKYGRNGADSVLGDDIWRDFDSEQIKDIPRHIVMHAMSYMRGDTSEDHIANIACNVMFMMYFESKAKQDSDVRIVSHMPTTIAG